jgi:hypothetical protein
MRLSALSALAFILTFLVLAQVSPGTMSVMSAKTVLPLLSAAGTLLAPGPSLEEGFRNPPMTARPATYYLWLNHYVNPERMDRELEEFKANGLGGLLIFDMGARGPQGSVPPAGPAFLSPESLKLIGRAVRTATRLGLEVSLSAISSWDMGGSWVTLEDSSKALVETSLEVSGPRRFSGVLPFPKVAANVPRLASGLPAWYQDVAVLAVPNAGKSVIEAPAAMVDLTAKLGRDGHLDWDVPAGNWKLLRFVAVPTGERLKVPSPNSDGWATDHLSAAVTRRYMNYVLERLRGELGDFRKTALGEVYLASYEVRGGIWTPEMPQLFRRYRGYDILPYLPALAGAVVKDQATTERFVYDYRKTLGDLTVDAYYRAARDAAHAAGLGIRSEAGGPGPPVHQVPVDALKALGSMDSVQGEFWPRRWNQDAMWVVKETATAAHIYGQRRVHMESFTSNAHFQDGPQDLKPSADRVFCEGANHIVWHTASHQPPEAGLPGWYYSAGTHLSPSDPWWPMARPFLDYLARASFLLQQGLFVADVLYYYGDQGFNFVPPKHVDPSLGYGYDYDVVNPEVIHTRLSVREGRLALPDGMSYELLVLPEREDMDLDVLRRVEALVRAGATVVGPRPVRANGLTGFPGRDEEVRRLAEKIWGPCDGQAVREQRYGRGRVIWGRSLREILTGRKIGPDFSFTSPRPDTQLDFIHRRAAGADIYFVRNVKPQWESVEAAFRVAGKQPELWLPDSGEIRPRIAWRAEAGATRVPLRLAPYDAVFVVFRRAATGPPPSVPAEAAAEEREVGGPWRLSFPEGWGAPASITLPELISWTDHADAGVRYFSGAARYERDIDIPAGWLGGGRKVYLDLGRLWVVGEVSLNGKPLGVAWKEPFRVEITPAARPGANHLAVTVANTWSNRLVGDALQAGGRRYTRTNITATDGLPWAKVPLLKSGLFGPVRLIVQ